MNYQVALYRYKTLQKMQDEADAQEILFYEFDNLKEATKEFDRLKKDVAYLEVLELNATNIYRYGYTNLQKYHI